MDEEVQLEQTVRVRFFVHSFPSHAAQKVAKKPKSMHDLVQDDARLRKSITAELTPSTAQDQLAAVKQK